MVTRVAARTAEKPDERILILAPSGKDGPLACRELHRAGLYAVACADVVELCQELHRGAATLFLAEEALSPATTTALVEILGQQPSWSDLPVVIATGQNGSNQRRWRTLHLLELLGNVTFLERPVRIMTLVSTLRTTLRARRRQYEVRDLLAQLHNAVRQRDDFLAMLGHELRNPLAPIRNAVEALRLCEPLEPQVRWARDLIDRQAQHLTRLVDDLLEASRLTRGKISLRLENLDLATVVASAVETARPMIESRHHDLTVGLPQDPVWVQGDRTRLAQILTNLLNNAAKYTDQSGNICLNVEPEGEQAVIRVRDDGMGMPAQLLSCLFEPFVQGERPADRSQGGLGLGLAVVRKLVELHGGMVQALSDGPGKGSEFVVRLPRLMRPHEGASEAEETNAGTPRQSARHLLVIEDNPDAAESLATVLRLAGHAVQVARDGPSGLAAARQRPPDAVLLDIGLPGMDGYEVAGQIRQEPRLQKTLLLAVTGYGREEDRQRSQAAGFDGHFVKPVDLDKLQAALNHAGR